MKSDQIISWIEKWIYKIAPENPSGQDQIGDHMVPHMCQSLFLLTLPFGIYLGLIPVIFSFYKEFIEDGHWKDIFSNTDSGKDGSCDLFFRLGGSILAYVTLLWR